MKRTLLSLMLLIPMSALAANQECAPVASAPTPDTVPAPEMQHAPPVASTCVDQSADAYLSRLRNPQPVVTAPAPAVPAGTGTAYVPKTEHDNSPWRFDMNQNGKRMTAAEFDDWMEAKGIRVATGVASGHRSATQGTAPANPVTPAPDTKPSPPPAEID